jgi:hypothetical protein
VGVSACKHQGYSGNLESDSAVRQRGTLLGSGIAIGQLVHSVHPYLIEAAKPAVTSYLHSISSVVSDRQLHINM